MSTSDTSSLWARFNRAPLILRAYLAFAVVEATLPFSSLYAPPLSRFITPLMGWSSSYLFTLYFAIAAIFGGQRKLLYAVPFIIAVTVTFSGSQLFSYLVNEEAVSVGLTNPYLNYHPYRPIFTIALPTAWALLLVSPMMRNWIHDSGSENIDGRSRQFSIRDLLYMIFVVALCMGMALPLVGLVREANDAARTQTTSP